MSEMHNRMAEQTTLPPDFPVDQIRAYYADRLRAPGERYRAALAETLTDWRLGRASQPANFSGADEVVRAGIAEVLTLRLTAAYNPIFRTLQRIENQLAILASVREDVCAPPVERRGEVAQIRPPEYWRRQPQLS